MQLSMARQRTVEMDKELADLNAREKAEDEQYCKMVEARAAFNRGDEGADALVAAALSTDITPSAAALATPASAAAAVAGPSARLGSAHPVLLTSSPGL
jgi:hypothetical protein